MAEDRVSIIVRLRDQASRGLKRLEGAFRRMSQVTLRGLRNAFATVTIAIGATTEALRRITERGGEVINIQRAFSRVSGDAETAIRTLRQATQGLVSDMDLMTQFNQAVALGVTDNADNFAELAETALALGRAMGVDANRALESLTLGIGRQSKFILDNLGITVSAEQAYRDYAEQLGKTAGDLTDMERRQAFLNATLEAAEEAVEKMGGLQANAADAGNRFSTAIRNLTDRISELVAQSRPVEDFFNSMADGLQGIRIELEGGPAMEAARQTLAGLEGASLEALRGRARSAADELREMQMRAEEVAGTSLEGVFTRELEAAEFLLREINTRIREFNREAPKMRETFQLPEVGPRLLAGIGGPLQDQRITGAILQTQLRPEQRPGGLALPFGQREFEGLAQEIAQAGDVSEDMTNQLTAMEQAGQVAIASMGSVLEATITGFQDIERIVVSSITNILQTLAQQQSSFLNLGGFGVPLIGAVGGIVGALFSGGRSRPKVDVEKFGQEAERQLERADPGPDVVTIVLTDSRGNVESVHKAIRRRESRDAVTRLPATVGPTFAGPGA